MTRFKNKAAKSKIGFTSKAPAKERKFAQRGPDVRMPPGCIAWNFKSVELEDPRFSCTVRQFLRYSKIIVDRFEGKTVDTIIQETRHHSHKWEFGEVRRLDPDLQKVLLKHGGEQQDFFQLDLGGKSRLWGFLRENVFCLICFDMEHEGYKVAKKHT